MKLFNVLFALVMIAVFSSCSKEDNPEGVFEAELIGSFCGYQVVEIRDSAYTHLGMGWRNSSCRVYNSVFTVNNVCDFSGSNIKTGSIFRCRVIEKPVTDNCGVCAGFMEHPDKKQNIEVVSLEQ
jgi:hypothetical protein